MKQIYFAFLLFAFANFAVSQSPSRIATVYRNDPIASTFSFTYGTPGKVIQSNNVANYQSDLDFGNYYSGEITAGIEGGREAVIIDLGDQLSLASRYGYSETVGLGQGYASIQFNSTSSQQLVIRSATQWVYQDLNETSELYNSANPSHIFPVVNHVVLVRITDIYVPTFEKVVKMLILSVSSDYVTFRYDVLRDLTTNPVPPPNGTSEIATIYPRDEITKLYGLSAKRAGLCYCGGPICEYCDVCNCNSDIDYDYYGQDSISAGLEGGRVANVIDIGTETDLFNLYGINVVYYASIQLSNNSVVVDSGVSLNLRNESSSLFATPSPYYVSVPAYLDHIYLIRITDTYDPTFDRIAKLKIISLEDDNRMIFRYDLLRDTEPSQPFFDRTNNGTFITTLYSNDPETHSFDFGNGASGGIIDEGGVYNRGSDIDIDNYYVDQFTVGIEGAESGIILDLGAYPDLRSEYSPYLLGFSAAFAGIYFNTTYNVTEMVNRTTAYPLAENALLMNDSQSYTNTYIYLNHVYILRLWNSYDSSFRRIVKLHVVHYSPREEITFRWMVLDRPESTVSTTGDVTGTQTTAMSSISGASSITVTLVALVIGFLFV